ncbi:MAG: hypothetical protein Q4B07_04650 [Clostridia bacterium]|nr:hypothetical protein [Clostridia bacterium]
MKMTRPEWRYLQRIALDHPYYDTHKLPLTEAEARTIMEKNNTMTGKEFVDSVYAKLGMTRPAKEQKRFALLRGIGGLLAVPPIRRIAIVVLAILLLTVFFAATPAGRAIAESVIRYIVTLFEDGRVSAERNDNEAPLVTLDTESVIETGELDENDDFTGYVYIESFDEFTVRTGKKPVVLPLPYTELFFFHETDIDYLVLNATYETTEGTIITLQTWNAECLASSTLEGYSTYAADNTIYYSVKEGKERIYCIKVFDDSIFNIMSKGSFSLEDLISMLKNKKTDA